MRDMESGGKSSRKGWKDGDADVQKSKRTKKSRGLLEREPYRLNPISQNLYESQYSQIFLGFLELHV